MKTILDHTIASQLITRISSLKQVNKSQWGKMNGYQMLKHCTLSEEMFQRKKTYKRLFIGRIFGGIALRGILKNDQPLKRNQPTHPVLKVKGTGDFEQERVKWIQLMKDYSNLPDVDFIHPFFGKMTKEQIGQFVYKHADHHLRQFGV